MKRVLLLVLIVLCTSVVATARDPGSIGIFDDPSAADCDGEDTGSLVTLYLFHVFTDGATASQFKLDVSNTDWLHLGDNWIFTTWDGTSIDGVSVEYGACLSGPIHLATIHFFGSNEPPCTYVGIVPHPDSPSGRIEGFDCAETRFFPTGGQFIVNPVYYYCGCWVPVQQTTWGGIKALYE